MRHIKTKHPNAEKYFAVVLDDVDFYYDFIKNLPDLDSKAKLFVSRVNFEIEKSAGLVQAVPPSAHQLQEWHDLENKVAIDQGKEHWQKRFFCKVCGFQLIHKPVLDKHVKSKHPNIKGEGSVLLDNVEFYYHSIKNLPELDEKVQPFLDAVEHAIAKHSNAEPLPGRQLQEWRDMENNINRVKGRKICKRNFFCNICGKIVIHFQNTKVISKKCKLALFLKGFCALEFYFCNFF
jgi:hypothetical protein